jgi:uncharacterized protein (TIGR02452 family)
MIHNYRKINFEVMTDTKQKYETLPELKMAVDYSMAHQYMVAHEENIAYLRVTENNTIYKVTDHRSFEAARQYKGKKVAVLNFANNHSIGGAPFYAGAQEESLCRCSTLLPCLEAMREPFYQKHIRQSREGEIGFMGNDDLIYTPDVVVFKTDGMVNGLVCPEMMPEEDWYKVNVITCAAPELQDEDEIPVDYEEQLTSRVRKILDMAAMERNEVLILGAWGCGAFENPVDVVAGVFHKLLKNYDFELVEFAIGAKGNLNYNVFSNEFD